MRGLPWLIAILATASWGYASAEEGSASGSPGTSHSRVAVPTYHKAPPPPVATGLNLVFTLQDQAATGNQESLSALKQLLLRTGPAVTAFASSASDDELRLLAPLVAAYVLSGGDPSTAAALSGHKALDLRHRRLLEGSALFMQGDLAAAARLFADIQYDQLPARTLGRVALVQALLEKDDPTARQKHLAVAMAAMPGSLVEESALRRSVLGFAETGEEAKFWDQLGRYQRRFPRSLFAEAFWREISEALVKWAIKKPSLALSRLDLVWSDGDISARRRRYAELARQAAALNERRVTEFAAARLQRLAVAGSAEDQSARLYMSIYKITSPEGDDALHQLKLLQRDLLGEQELALLAAALAVNAQIRRPLPMASTPSLVLPEEDAIYAKSREMMSDSDKLLERSIQ